MGLVKGMNPVNTETYTRDRNFVWSLVKEYSETKDVHLLGLAASIHLDGRKSKGEKDFPNVSEMFTEAMSGHEREGVVFAPSYFNNENKNADFQFSHWAVLVKGKTVARIFLRDFYNTLMEAELGYEQTLRQAFTESQELAGKIYNTAKKFKMPS